MIIQTPSSSHLTHFAALESSSPKDDQQDLYRVKQIPEPYPYTNQQVSSFKHAELILSGVEDEQESIDDYDYLKQPLTPATDHDSEHFYRMVHDSRQLK